MSAKKYDLKIRVWHWLSALIIMGSLLTVLINSTLLDKDQNPFVQKELQDAGVALSAQQARAATHGLEDQVWGIHIYFGYALAALFLFRLVSEFFLPQEKKFLFKLRQVYKNYLNKSRLEFKHTLGVKILYAIFYITLFIMVCTGLSLAFQDNFGISRTLGHTIKDVHGFCFYIVLSFAAVHIVGIVVAEFQKDRGIVSDMINGGDSEIK